MIICLTDGSRWKTASMSNILIEDGKVKWMSESRTMQEALISKVRWIEP